MLDFHGTKQIIARSGYSKQDGFEIYFKCFENYFDKNEMGEKIWDIIWKAGKEFNIAPGCPNLIDRIEAGLMSYGNDFTKENNPCLLYTSPSPRDATLSRMPSSA